MSSLRAFTMPKWGIEMTEGTVAKWMIEEGQPFRKGDLLALIETDKITNEIEAEYDGIFPRLIAKPGETLPVGALIAVVADVGDDAAAQSVDDFIAQFVAADTSVASQAGAKKPATKAEPAAAAAPERAPSPSPAAGFRLPDGLNLSAAARVLCEQQGFDPSGLKGSGAKGRITLQDVEQAMLPSAPQLDRDPCDIQPTSAQLEHIYASPLARRLAVLHKVSLDGMKGSGPRGRISKADVLREVKPAAAQPAAPENLTARPPEPTAGVKVVAMSPMRKAIARALTQSKSTIPHFYLRTEVQVDALLALRAQARKATGDAPSVNDYIVKACAVALAEHPDINIQVHGDEIHQFPNADISIAVATERGLITPILRAADTLSVAAISWKIKDLAERARAGSLKPEEFQGGSFSVSNLGMFGIDEFDAIINPPQGAILAVSAARRRPIDAGHALAFATTMRLSLSCDHRAIDGAVGARFMQTLKAVLENPERMIGD